MMESGVKVMEEGREARLTGNEELPPSPGLREEVEGGPEALLEGEGRGSEATGVSEAAAWAQRGRAGRMMWAGGGTCV